MLPPPPSGAPPDTHLSGGACEQKCPLSLSSSAICAILWVPAWVVKATDVFRTCVPHGEVIGKKCGTSRRVGDAKGGGTAERGLP